MIIIENRFRNWVGILASIFLGMTFIVAGISKWLYPGTALEVPEVFLIVLLVAELGIGILLVAGIQVKPMACVSLFLIVCFIISNSLLMILGVEDCFSCFGSFAKLSTGQALWLDGIMVALAVTILVFYPSRFFSVRPWYWGK